MTMTDCTNPDHNADIAMSGSCASCKSTRTWARQEAPTDAVVYVVVEPYHTCDDESSGWCIFTADEAAPDELVATVKDEVTARWICRLMNGETSIRPADTQRLQEPRMPCPNPLHFLAKDGRCPYCGGPAVQRPSPGSKG